MLPSVPPAMIPGRKRVLAPLQANSIAPLCSVDVPQSIPTPVKRHNPLTPLRGDRFAQNTSPLSVGSLELDLSIGSCRSPSPTRQVQLPVEGCISVSLGMDRIELELLNLELEDRERQSRFVITTIESEVFGSIVESAAHNLSQLATRSRPPSPSIPFSLKENLRRASDVHWRSSRYASFSSAPSDEDVSDEKVFLLKREHMVQRLLNEHQQYHEQSTRFHTWFLLGMDHLWRLSLYSTTMLRKATQLFSWESRQLYRRLQFEMLEGFERGLIELAVLYHYPQVLAISLRGPKTPPKGTRSSRFARYLQ